MTRRRSNPHTKKQTTKNSGFKQNHLVYIAIIALIVVASGAIIALQSDQDQEQNQNSSSTTTHDKWLFAMDTDNVQSKYQASGIPTLAIINRNGNIIFYNRGAHSKDQLMPYVESALDGTAENLGEAPDFTVTTFDGESFKLSDQQGKVVLLDIMGVGCPPCEMQMPELQKIKKEKGEDIIILSIDVYYSGETKQDVIDTYGEYIKE
ncbi:MAG: redoxin family protein [Thermoplasmatota archaeon]